MYEQYFGLSEKPFSILPDPSFLYWGRTHRLAYAMLEYGVLNHAGISVVTGEVGCGKTTLVHRLLDQLSDTHTVALLSNIQEGRGDLLSWVLMGFGEPFAGKTHVELFSQLQSFFISEYAKGRRVVLIIDEAQNLSIDMLEELRMLSNINAGKDQLLQLILVGQPQLKDLLNQPELLQLAQRIGSDFHLTPLNKEEVHAYLETRLSIAGCRRRVFTDRAIDLIAEQSRGVPRVINIIADTALVYAFSAEELVVGVETIRNVIHDKTEFGVFGIASDEKAAPPLRPASDPGGIDSFSEASKQKPAKNDSPRDIARDPSPETHDETDDDEGAYGVAAPPSLESADEPAAAQVEPIADFKTTVAVSASTADRRPVADRPFVREESSVTGVVVVASNIKTSPEAAIRSAGDGRAIVFAAVGEAPESMSIARKAGAVVVDGGRALNSAGRARNAGYRQLKRIAPHLQYVQFVDAECALDPDWISTGEKFMARRPEVSVIEGLETTPKGRPFPLPTWAEQKRRQKEGEIQTVVGAAAMVRAESFEAAGGFRGDLITAEMEDLCVRLRRRGGRIWRLDAVMDVRRPLLNSIGGWWAQGFRRGFENAYCASLHGGPPERLGVAQIVRAAFWGFVFPAGILAAAAASWFVAAQLAPMTPTPVVVGAVLAFGAAVYALKILASAFLRGAYRPSSWRNAFAAVLGPFPEFSGVCSLWFRRK